MPTVISAGGNAGLRLLVTGHVAKAGSAEKRRVPE